MGLVDSATVKALLPDLNQQPLLQTDLELRLNASGLVTLPHRGLVADSELVKTIHSLIPDSETGVTLSGETWISLAYDNLVPGEIVVASDNGLTTVYQLDVDYLYRAATGEIRRVAGGAISDGGSVKIFYLRYDTYDKTIDYTIDCQSGSLSLVESGGLIAETTIWVDYELSYSSLVDQLVDEAITVAEDKVLARLKPDYTLESTDQGLISGATELTLSLISRSLAGQALVDGRPAAEGRSRAWRNLAEKYELNSWQTLQPFIASPVMTGSNRQANSNWGWQ